MMAKNEEVILRNNLLMQLMDIQSGAFLYKVRGCLKSLNYYLPWRLEIAATRDFTHLSCGTPRANVG